MWELHALDVLGFGTAGGKEKSSETDSVNASDDATRLKKVIGMPSIWARTQAQRKRTSHVEPIIRWVTFLMSPL